MLLVSLVLVPADIAFVVVFDEYLPRPDRFAVAIAPPRAPIDDGGSFLAFPVNIN